MERFFCDQTFDPHRGVERIEPRSQFLKLRRVLPPLRQFRPDPGPVIDQPPASLFRLSKAFVDAAHPRVHALDNARVTVREIEAVFHAELFEPEVKRNLPEETL